MVIPSPWSVTNLTMYNTLPTCTVIFGVGVDVELVKLGLLAKFNAQLIGLSAWQVPKIHQGTYQKSQQSVIF